MSDAIDYSGAQAITQDTYILGLNQSSPHPAKSKPADLAHLIGDGTFLPVAAKGAAGGVAPLDSNAKVAAATLADGYGDAKNPYSSKAKGNVLAAPSNAAGMPAFRSLVADDIPQLSRGKIADLYPVGAIYLSVNSTSPASLFGGTWEQLKDRFLLGAGDVYSNGAAGGSADAMVVSHGHTFSGVNRTGSAGNFIGVRGPSTGVLSWTEINYSNTRVGSNLGCLTVHFNMTPEGTISSSGESGAGKNMPPYLAVYMWKRIA